MLEANHTTQDLTLLQTLGLNQSIRCHLAGLDWPAHSAAMRVVEVQRDRVQLLGAQGGCDARLRPELLQCLRNEGQTLAVGDWVLAAQDAFGGHWVQAQATRLNALTRRNPEGLRQTLVANVDTALLVMGLDHDFNLARLDRYLVLTHAAGIASVVVLSKADRCAQVQARLAEVQAHLRACREGPQAVLAVNGTQASARESLWPWLGAGQTLVLLGSSGAGKSTLTNSLCAAQLQDTGGVREDDSRGRHTTSVRSLHRAPCGACIIDTPGLRGLQLDVNEQQLAEAFDDIGALAPHCRFRNCSHQDEPGCAVRDALSAARLKSYHKLQRELGREQRTPLQRQAEVSEWKSRSREARIRMKAKSGA
ncbi:ribosome small subunit-dependent GTPase A [Paucibacter soli]|uniref:ribosome small subunit-dependent GTPase A n=1 Tax=Paucibacter soli TaxID=3133433 RepID=UPI00309E75A2